MAFAFDTVAQTKRLRDAGFDEKQAEALTAVLYDAILGIMADFATKADVAMLAIKVEIAELKADLIKWVVGMIGGAVVLNAIVVVATMFVLAKLLAH